ncbi:alpha/beta hydrolase [Paenibacillus sp. CAU 1782]
MARIQCDFFSETLGINTSMSVILPQQTRTQIGMNNVSGGGRHKTLYLLHGFSDDDTIWSRRTSVERYVAESGIAVVMPNAHTSFYTDMEYGGAYWTFLSEELPALARSFFPLSHAKEDNYVAGLSMGGYGAFKWALRRPDMFAAAGSFSGALDLAGFIKKTDKNSSIGRAFNLIFGQREIDGSDDDLLALAERAGQAGALPPRLFQSCGTEDFLYEENLAFRDKCRESGVELHYAEGPGDHSWEYWDVQIQHFLKWL